jgi:hypothetical protein
MGFQGFFQNGASIMCDDDVPLSSGERFCLLGMICVFLYGLWTMATGINHFRQAEAKWRREVVMTSEEIEDSSKAFFGSSSVKEVAILDEEPSPTGYYRVVVRTEKVDGETETRFLEVRRKTGIFEVPGEVAVQWARW